MADISRVALFGKLNRLGYQAIESATVFCKLRGNPYVELVHWFNQILQLQDSDLHRIVRHFEVDPNRLAQDLIAALDRLPRGATAISDLSTHVCEAVERGWVYSTLLFGDSQVRTGHLLVGILKTPSLYQVLLGISREFAKLQSDPLSDQFSRIVSGSPETNLTSNDGSRLATAAPGEASGALPPAQLGKQEALNRYAVDLTERARRGELDAVIGRSEEIRQLVDILMRRRQNNPLLTGEAGVGKTAVVEGFAARIASGEVPPPLRDVSLRTLDLGLLQAGASMKGEFEARLRAVIEEVQASPKPIILFIDEAHTLIGAGGTAGTGDAANLLKPALARGTLRTIAATTWAEYKKYIEKDPALTRRFQIIQVGEPSEAAAVQMLRGIAQALEQHHRVQLLDEALIAAVQLSHRYIPARQLPDKAVSLLDTAAARVAIGLHAVPAAVEDSRRQCEALCTELTILAREQAIGLETVARDAAARQQLASEETRLAELEQRWQSEKVLVDQILDLRQQLRTTTPSTESTQSTPSTESTEPTNLNQRHLWLEQLQSLQQQLTELQGETPLLQAGVDAAVVAAVVADWTGIPVGRMLRNEVAAVLQLADTLNQRVLGQRHALDMIARRIQTSRAGLDNPNKPIGVFLLAGPSGVGKTETALALAEALYGGEQNLITLNMSEFQEAHTVSTLKGAPPGYVGYGEGGVLTEAVRRRPYSVVLLDEMEKAHPDVHELFFQVFDKGWMEDGEGRVIDFKNTLILLTSNVGSELLMPLCQDPDLLPAADALTKALREPLLKVFPAALLGRLVVIPYYPLTDALLADIVRLQLRRLEQRIATRYQIPFSYDAAVVQTVVSRCTELESGARAVDAILTNTLLPALSQAFLNRRLTGQSVSRVHVAVADSDFVYQVE